MAKAYILALCETGSDDYVISQLKKISDLKNIELKILDSAFSGKLVK